MVKNKIIFLILISIQIILSSNLRKASFISKSELESKDDVILMSTEDITINLFTINSNYAGVLEIPKDKYKLYQIPEGSSGKYAVASGSSVTVNSFGTITPRNTTWYWYGSSATITKDPNREPTKITVSYYLGTSVVSATIGDKTYKITLYVKDYADEYVETEINNYIKNNVTTKNTLVDKLRAITAYPAQFPYKGGYYTYKMMVIYKGGDCWASSYTINYMCQKVGIKSHIRYAVKDPGAGSGHLNVAALIDGKIYIAEAGYGISSPNRPYSVTELNVGFSIKSANGGIIIYQYDGFDEDITVPSSINGKTVIGLDTPVFLHGASNSGIKIKKITLPDTIQTIGNSVFSKLHELKTITIPKNVSKIGIYNFQEDEKLASINVDSNNPYFTSEDGILYNKDKTQIIGFPPGKNGNYTGISSLTKIGEYSFYYVKNVKKVIIPESVKTIGEGAFAHSGVKEILFMGEKPEFGKDCFLDANVTLLYENGSSHAIIWVLVVIFIIIIGLGIAWYIIRNKKLNGFSFKWGKIEKLIP